MPTYLLLFEDGLALQTPELEKVHSDAVEDGTLRAYRFQDDSFFELMRDGTWREVLRE